MKDLFIKTRENFSFGWSKFAGKEIKKNWHKDSFSYLKFIPLDILSGKEKIGLDAGCGSGADMRQIAQYKASILGVDISDSISLTRKNLNGYKNLYLAQADISHLPVKDKTFDFIYSFGVLHHLLDTKKGFKALSSKLKIGGFLIIYVYEDFSQRSLLELLLLKTVNLGRIITTKMPPFILYLFCLLATPLIFLSCSLPYQILKRIPVSRGLAEKIPYRHTLRLDCLTADLYDRFSAPIERRFNREQVVELFTSNNFSGINIVNYRGWIAWGKKA